MSLESAGQAICLHMQDNVATALTDLACGSVPRIEGSTVVIQVHEAIPFGHKFALADLPVGALVIKYGVPIGSATQPIRQGDHVHTQNLATRQRQEVSS